MTRQWLLESEVLSSLDECIPCIVHMPTGCSCLLTYSPILLNLQGQEKVGRFHRKWRTSFFHGKISKILCLTETWKCLTATIRKTLVLDLQYGTFTAFLSKAQPFARQLLENSQRGLFRELQAFSGKSEREHTLAEIVIHTSAALQCVGSGSLAEPLYALMTDPSTMTVCICNSGYILRVE